MKISRWPNRLKGTKKFVSICEERWIVCDCTPYEKINFEGFTQNGCYGNQPLPFQSRIDSIYANSSCSFTKQDLTFKQVRFCFVLGNQPKFWQLTLVFSPFYRLYLEMAIFCTNPVHKCSFVTRQMQNVSSFWLIASRHYWSLITPSFGNYPLILFKVEMLVWSQLVQKETFE